MTIRTLFEQLRHTVPTTISQEGTSDREILQEAAKYIDQLHDEAKDLEQGLANLQIENLQLRLRQLPEQAFERMQLEQRLRELLAGGGAATILSDSLEGTGSGAAGTAGQLSSSAGSSSSFAAATASAANAGGKGGRRAPRSGGKNAGSNSRTSKKEADAADTGHQSEGKGASSRRARIVSEDLDDDDEDDEGDHTDEELVDAASMRGTGRLQGGSGSSNSKKPSKAPASHVQSDGFDEDEDMTDDEPQAGGDDALLSSQATDALWKARQGLIDRFGTTATAASLAHAGLSKLEAAFDSQQSTGRNTPVVAAASDVRNSAGRLWVLEE